MVLPLLGLLGLAATAAAKPYYDDWVEGRNGRQADRALTGTTTFDEQQRALLNAGLLSAQDYVGLTQDESQFGRGLAQDESQFGRGMVQDESQFGRSLNVDQQRTDLQRDQFDFDRTAMDREMQANLLHAQQLATSPVGQEAMVRGNPWLTMDPEARAGITRMEDAIGFTGDMLDYVEGAGGLSRPLDDQSSAEWRTRYQLTVLPVLKDLMGAGALDENERAWFDEVMGDPLSWVQLTEGERARVRGIGQVIDAELSRRRQSFGLHDVNPRAGEGVPQGLTQGLPPAEGGVAAPRLMGQVAATEPAGPPTVSGLLSGAYQSGDMPEAEPAPRQYSAEVQDWLDWQLQVVAQSDQSDREKMDAIAELYDYADRLAAGG